MSDEKSCFNCDNFEINIETGKRKCLVGRPDFGHQLTSGRTEECSDWKEK